MNVPALAITTTSPSREARRWWSGRTGGLIQLLSVGPTRDLSNSLIRAEQIREIVRSAPVSIACAAATTILVAVDIWRQVPLVQLLSWLAAMGASFLFRLGVCYGLRSGKWAMLLRNAFVGTTLTTAFVALLWLVPAFLWFDYLDPNSRIILTLVLIGLMSGGSTTMAPVPPAATAFILILSTALVRMMMFYHSWITNLLAVILALVLCQSVVSAARLFSKHVMARRELEEQGELISLLREFQSNGSEWLWELDADLRIRYISHGMAEALGLGTKTLIGQEARVLFDPSGDHRGFSEGIRTMFRQVQAQQAFHEIAFPSWNGERWYCLSGRPVRDDHGQVTGWRGVGSDLTQARFGEGTESVKIARRDPLTGLGNRLLVREMIEEARLKQRTGIGECTLLLLDLDRFKSVNDTLGHAMGDRLLVEVARRLQSACGPEGGVGRLGGDEFAVIWRGASNMLTLINLAERIAGSIAEPFALGHSAMHVGVTVGIARAPLDGETQDQLMRSADLALYRAKERQRGQHCFFEPWMLAKAQAERLLENDVREAVRRGDLRLHYQPIVDSVSRRRVGHEALLRWWHPRRGAIGPDVFVPIIEDVGVIHEIGAWVIHEACAQAATWPGQERVAVNVSVAQLTGAGLKQSVQAALAISGLAPTRLELEVTESIFLGDDAATLAALAGLQQLGVRLVLDDFGKGYSSFGYLSRACFAKIKIDQLFVRGAAAGERDCTAIVRSILALAAGLGIETTAEGVETSAQAEIMTTLGCTQLQGYLFGRAVAPDGINHDLGSPEVLALAARRRA